jgi:hypothetical protein
VCYLSGVPKGSDDFVVGERQQKTGQQEDYDLNRII